MIKERQMEGIEQARKQGKHLGRYPKLNPEQKADLYARFRKGSSKRSLSKIFGVSRATVYNIINELEIKT